MPTPKTIVCMSCQHYRGAEFTGGVAKGFISRCLAFPDNKGIPNEIINWENPHIDVRTDQEGDFVFKPIKNMTQETAEQRAGI